MIASIVLCISAALCQRNHNICLVSRLHPRLPALLGYCIYESHRVLLLYNSVLLCSVNLQISIITARIRAALLKLTVVLIATLPHLHCIVPTFVMQSWLDMSFTTFPENPIEHHSIMEQGFESPHAAPKTTPRPCRIVSGSRLLPKVRARDQCLETDAISSGPRNRAVLPGSSSHPSTHGSSPSQRPPSMSRSPSGPAERSPAQSLLVNTPPDLSAFSQSLCSDNSTLASQRATSIRLDETFSKPLSLQDPFDLSLDWFVLEDDVYTLQNLLPSSNSCLFSPEFAASMTAPPKFVADISAFPSALPRVSPSAGSNIPQSTYTIPTPVCKSLANDPNNYALTTLLQYLSLPNPSPFLVEQIVVPSRNSYKHFCTTCVICVIGLVSIWRQ